ncbi:MAG: hypothetical protein NVS9B15_15060 [Acidobacteriaceae bacterium]
MPSHGTKLLNSEALDEGCEEPSAAGQFIEQDGFVGGVGSFADAAEPSRVGMPSAAVEFPPE